MPSLTDYFEEANVDSKKVENIPKDQREAANQQIQRLVAALAEEPT